VSKEARESGPHGLAASDVPASRAEVNAWGSHFERILEEDVLDAAERTLRDRFGRLSNRRILAVLRQAAIHEPSLCDAPDAVLLDLWFTAYALALQRLRDTQFRTD
jgi:hypothetical protein